MCCFVLELVGTIVHSQTELAADVVAALEWQAARTAEQVNMYREEVIQRLEATGEELWRSGQCKAWLEQLHPDIRAVAKNVNGPLLLALCKHVGHIPNTTADKTFVTIFVC